MLKIVVKKCLEGYEQSSCQARAKSNEGEGQDNGSKGGGRPPSPPVVVVEGAAGCNRGGDRASIEKKDKDKRYRED
jgi:hypothetical protein